MFNLIYKFLKKPIMPTSLKQKNRIFLSKDLRQYRIEYFKIISYMISKNWPLGNKSIDIENLKIIKITKAIFGFFVVYYIFYTIFILV